MASAEDRPKSSEKKPSRNIFSRFGRTISRAFHSKRRNEASHRVKRDDYRTKSSSELDRDNALSVSIDDLRHKTDSNQARCVSEGDLLAPGLFHRQDSADPLSTNSSQFDRKNFKNELSSKLLLRLNSSEDNRVSTSISSSSSPLCSPAINISTIHSTISGESGSLDFSSPTSDASVLDSSATKNKLMVARQRHRRHAPSSAVSHHGSASSEMLTNIQEESAADSNKKREDKSKVSPSALSAKLSFNAPTKPTDQNSKTPPPKLTPKPKSFTRRSDESSVAPNVALRSTATDGSGSSETRLSKSPSSYLASSERNAQSNSSLMSKSVTLPDTSSRAFSDTESFPPAVGGVHFSKRSSASQMRTEKFVNTRPFSLHDETLQSADLEKPKSDSTPSKPFPKRHTIEGGKGSSLVFTSHGKPGKEESLSRSRQHQSLKLPDTKNQGDDEDLSSNKRTSTVLDLIKNFQNLQATT